MSGRWCVLLLIASAWQPPTIAAAQEAGAESIFSAVGTAARDGKLTRSKVHGFSIGGQPYDDRPVPDALLVGFDVGVGKFLDHDAIYALRPIYRTPRGLIAGADIGQFTDRRDGPRLRKTKVLRTVQLRARPGLAVGGINLRTGLNISGLALLYMRIEGPRLAGRWSEISDWVGDRTSGEEAEITGDSLPVVGIFGRQDDEQVKAIGLYFARTPAPVVPPRPKVEEPPAPKAEKPAVAPRPAAEPPAAPAEAAPLPVAAAPAAGLGRFIVPVVIFVAVTVPILVALLVMNRREAAKALAPAPLAPQPRPLGALGEFPAAADAITAAAPPGRSGARLDPLDPRPEPWRLDEPVLSKSADFRKAAKDTALTLFAIAGMQFVCGLIALSIVPEKVAGGPVPAQAMPFMMLIVVGIAVLFAGLGVWAWSQPLPAAIVGLVAYIVIFLLDVAGALSNGNPQALLSGIFIKIGITAALVRCVTISASAASSDSLQEMLRQHERSRADEDYLRR